MRLTTYNKKIRVNDKEKEKILSGEAITCYTIGENNQDLKSVERRQVIMIFRQVDGYEHHYPVSSINLNLVGVVSGKLRTGSFGCTDIFFFIH